eukprot:9413642-Alexandrium_andersonii.AAC.1
MRASGHVYLLRCRRNFTDDVGAPAAARARPRRRLQSLRVSGALRRACAPPAKTSRPSPGRLRRPPP